MVQNNSANLNALNSNIYFIIDDSNSHCGLTDRLKAAVGLCYVARQNNIGFKFIHRAGFDLRDYLEPNVIPWSAELSDIARLPWKTRRIEYRPPLDSFPKFKANMQYICKRYIGKNIIEMTNVPDWQSVWRKLFWDMFTPSQIVKDALAHSGLPDRYVIVNARFINSLGMIEETNYNAPLPDDMQAKLIDAVLAKAAECEAQSDVPAILYSDSIRFLDIAANRGFHTISPKGIGNMMNSNADESVNLQSFVGMFQIAQADKVYSILNMEGFPEGSLYKTQYPRYAAIIGNRPFIRL
ncbi:MAG: hypothetical protein IKF56_00815 [Eggerthellaceae bacterium]|nr:hypothetical protein [Eggerthellaceae bacterium]